MPPVGRVPGLKHPGTFAWRLIPPSPVVPPQTKLYLLDAAAMLADIGASRSALTPTNDLHASTNHSGGSSPGSSQTSIISSAPALATASDFLRRFTLMTLAAQTIPAGNWTLACGIADPSIDMNGAALTWVIYAWRPSTSSLVGIIYDGPSQAGWPNTSPIFAQTPTEQAVSGSIAGGSLAVQDGDVLMLEVWGRTTPQNGVAQQDSQTQFFYNGTTEGSASSNAAYLLASGPLVFSTLTPVASALIFPVEAPGAATATDIIPVEAAGTASQTATAPVEAAQGIAAAAAEPLEQIGGVVQQVADPVEATAAAGSTAAFPNEAAQAITAAATEPAEATAATATSSSLPVETRQAASGTAAPLVEATGGIAATAVDPTEAVGGVSAPAILPIEATTDLLAAAGLPIEAALAVTSAAAAALEALSGLASGRGLPIDAAAAAAALALLPLEQIQGDLAALALLPLESLQAATPVSQTVTFPVEALLELAAPDLLPLSATGTAPTPPTPPDDDGAGGGGFPHTEGWLARMLAQAGVDEDEARRVAANADEEEVAAILALFYLGEL